MSVQVKRRRDTAANLASFIGAQAELLVDTTNNRLQVHDGVTAGGWPAAKLAEVVTNARTAVSDANYNALPTDRSIAYTALTAARTVTLPASSLFPTGTRLVVFDESGSCSATNAVTLARAGADTIDGATSAVISSAYGFLALQSNGAGKWTIVDQAMSNLGPVGIGTPADPNNPLSVYGPSALFNGASFNVTVNKAAAAGVASFIFEDGFSGRAQIGLCGDDNFRFKVSPNGANWMTAIAIDAATGAPTFANQRTAVADANYSAQATDRTIAYAAISAARTVTLPAAASFPPGAALTVVDESGACSGINPISVARAGSDTIDGATSFGAASFVIASPCGFVKLESNGANAWTVVGSQQTSGYPASLVFVARGVNLNAPGDTVVPIVLPPGFSRWAFNAVRLINASGSLASGAAKVGIYSGPAQTGAAFYSQQAVTAITTSSPDTMGGAMLLTANGWISANSSFSADPKIYVNVSAANGSPATVDVVIVVNVES